MAKESTGEAPAYIAHVAEDVEWAQRLRDELKAFEVDLVAASDARVEAMFPEMPTSATLSGATLIVLVTPASYDSPGLHYEIGRFEAQAYGERPLVISIVFGTDLVAKMIDRLQMRQFILVDRDVYDANDFDSLAWRQAVGGVRDALLKANEELRRQPPEPVGEPPQQVLRRARIDVLDVDQVGWLLGDDLAITAPGAGLGTQALSVRSDFGRTQGIASPWAQPSVGLHEMTLLRLDPALELPQPFPVDMPETGSWVEFWSATLERDGRGRIGDVLADGSFELILLEGEIERGPALRATWDTMKGRYLGISSRAANGDWRLFPLMGLREMAGKPAQSAAIRPPSAHIHDDSWTIEDRLDYALYGRVIKEFVEHPDTKPPLVIGVQGPWGQGKTSLMRIAQERLDGQHADLVARRKATASAMAPTQMTLKDLRDSLDGDVELARAETAEVRSVWFNPWKYQSSEALWAGLAHAILTQLPARLTRREQELFWLKLQLHRIDAAAVRRDIHRLIFDRLLPWLMLSVLVALMVALACLIVGASAVVGAVGGLISGATAAGLSWLMVSKRALEGKLEGSYLRYVRQPDYADKMGYLHHVEEDVRAALELLTPGGRPTVIFIDDLDRCGAAKISEVLEAINLFLSGDYPNCVFILGLDARIVASAMETVHRQALGEGAAAKDDREGNLGWRFLDKFIQLSFVVPRLSPGQREIYLASLIGRSDGAANEREAEELMDEARRVRRELVEGKIDAEQAAGQVGELAREAVPERPAVRQIAEDVIALGARDFSDDDPDAAAALRRRIHHLSDNPRTIKRAVNLYRFYRFISWARQASAPDLSAADPDLIASWTVIAARWPQVVHRLQTEGRGSSDPELLLREIGKKEEPDLCKFLDAEPELDLNWAKVCGLW